MKNRLTRLSMILLAVLLTFAAVIIVANPFVIRSGNSNPAKLPVSSNQVPSSQSSSNSVSTSVSTSTNQVTSVQTFHSNSHDGDREDNGSGSNFSDDG